MKTVTTIGLDIAKSVFQVHGIDAAGTPVIRKQLKRARVIPFFAKLPSCVVGIEACASSHYWARELTALGHEGIMRSLTQAVSLPNPRSGALIPSSHEDADRLNL